VTFDVEVRDRRHHVEVVRTAAGDHVSIDGRMFSSLIGGVPPFWSLLVKDGLEAGQGPTRSHEVAFDFEEATGTLVVNVDGAVVPVRLVDRRRSRARGGSHAELTGAHPLRAPMPGRIVRVLVTRGEQVAARQPLVVMEAMKMENELQAPLAGTVTDVFVEAGSAVDADALLAIVTA
jgi:biotin carboxyl carrier protein